MAKIPTTPNELLEATRPLQDEILDLAAKVDPDYFTPTILRAVRHLRDWLFSDRGFTSLVSHLQDPESRAATEKPTVSETIARLATSLSWPIHGDPDAEQLLSQAWASIGEAETRLVQPDDNKPVLGDYTFVDAETVPPELRAHQHVFKVFYRTILQLTHQKAAGKRHDAYVTPIATPGRLHGIIVSFAKPEPSRAPSPDWRDVVQVGPTVGDLIEAHVPSSIADKEPNIVLMLATAPRHDEARVFYEPRWKHLQKQLKSHFDTKGRVEDFRSAFLANLSSTDRLLNVKDKPGKDNDPYDPRFVPMAGEIQSEYIIRDVNRVAAAEEGLSAVVRALYARHLLRSIQGWDYDRFRKGEAADVTFGQPVPLNPQTQNDLVTSLATEQYDWKDHMLFVKAQPPSHTFVFALSFDFEVCQSEPLPSIAQSVLSDIGRLSAWIGSRQKGGALIDIDRTDNLNEVIYHAIHYKSGKYETVEELAEWMDRSVPTAYRLRHLAERYFYGELSDDEARQRLDLNKSASKKKGRPKKSGSASRASGDAH